MTLLADRILSFQKKLRLEIKLPGGEQVMNPYQEGNASALCKKFYKTFYNDNAPRTMILGINPGRHGGGITGIPFTDPVKLEKFCGIPNDLPRKAELSADFMHAM